MNQFENFKMISFHNRFLISEFFLFNFQISTFSNLQIIVL